MLTDLITEAPDTCAFIEQETPKQDFYLTASQEVGLERLKSLAEVHRRTGGQSHAGFSPRLRPLVIGPSGSGKSCLIRIFSKQQELPLIQCDGGAWLPLGAHKTGPGTLRMLRDFVRQQVRGIIFLDELDKCVPNTDGLHSSAYSLAVFAECISLLDSQGRLGSHEWSEADIAKLNRRFLIIGGAAFQEAYDSALEQVKQGQIGFRARGGQSFKEIYLQKLSSRLPTEILARFNEDPVFVEPPARADIRSALMRIHRDLGLPRPDMEILLDRAAQANNGVRWIESYLTDLLITNPEARREVESGDESMEARMVEMVAGDAHHYFRQVVAQSGELRGVVAKLWTAVRRHERSLLRSTAGKRVKFRTFIVGARSDGVAHLLQEVLKNVIPAAYVGDDELQREALREWAWVGWTGLADYHIELEEAGLLALWVEAWSLSAAILDLRTKLTSLAQEGRL